MIWILNYDWPDLKILWIDVHFYLAGYHSKVSTITYILFSVLLRQNPHNVHEWLKRVKLYDGKPQEVILFV